jgi:hypothetical protein
VRSLALLCAGLLAAGRPLTLKEIKKLLGSDADSVSYSIKDLQTALQEADLGLVVEEVAGGYRLVVDPSLVPALAELLSPPPLPNLSNAALETLAIIAYKQPVTRGEIEAARGISASSVLETPNAVWYNRKIFTRVRSKISRRFAAARGHPLGILAWLETTSLFRYHNLLCCCPLAHILFVNRGCHHLWEKVWCASKDWHIHCA